MKLLATLRFTLVELLVCIAIIAILSTLLLPGLDNAKRRARGVQCMSNHRQLTVAWKMHNDDNNERLLFASGDYNRPELNPNAWVLGLLDFNPANSSNWDVERDVKTSPLWPYCGQSAAIWKCPADNSAITVNGKRLPRVRSMSMNLWLGGFAGLDYGLSDGAYRIFFSVNELTDPGPARTFVFLDMREDSIDIGNFATDMRGWPNNPNQTGFYDLPASYHDRAGGLSFADGHGEIRRWVDPRTMPPLVYNGLILDMLTSSGNPDIVWLQERSTRRK